MSSVEDGTEARLFAEVPSPGVPAGGRSCAAPCSLPAWTLRSICPCRPGSAAFRMPLIRSLPPYRRRAVDDPAAPRRSSICGPGGARASLAASTSWRPPAAAAVSRGRGSPANVPFRLGRPPAVVPQTHDRPHLQMPRPGRPAPIVRCIPIAPRLADAAFPLAGTGKFPAPAWVGDSWENPSIRARGLPMSRHGSLRSAGPAPPSGETAP